MPIKRSITPPLVYKYCVFTRNFLPISSTASLLTIFFSGVQGVFDVAFAFDASKNVHPSILNNYKRLTEELIKGFPISPSNVRVSMLSFGDNVESKSNFKDSSDLASVQGVLRDITYVNGPRRLAKLLQYVDSDVFSVTKGHRPNVGSVLIVFTDKRPMNLISDVARYSNMLKAKGVKIVVVGSGAGDVTPQTLGTVATNQDNIIIVPELRNMPSVFGRVEQAVANAIGMLFPFIYIYTYF